MLNLRVVDWCESAVILSSRVSQQSTAVELALDDNYDSASAEADALFHQIRKLKRGNSVVKNLLKETAEALLTLEEMELHLNACSIELETKTVDENMFRLIQCRLIRTSLKTGFSPPPDDKDAVAATRGSGGKSFVHNPIATTTRTINERWELRHPCLVLVGRNPRGNEYLAFNVARGDDIWMQ